MDFKIMLLNAENFFLLSDVVLTPEHLKLNEVQWQKFSTAIFNNKPLSKLKALSQMIKEQQPDIMLLVEVGGVETLKNFNSLFLDSQYYCALLDGNSERYIHVGFMIKKSLNVYFDILSNRNRPIDYLYPHEKASENFMSHRFSRDVAELHLFQRQRENPFLIFFLTHLKSQLDPEGIDPNGFERRKAEFKTLINLYQEANRKFKGEVPIALCGDFNGIATRQNPDSEFSLLYEDTELKDVCEIAQVPIEKTYTYFHVGRSYQTEGRQLDYAFLSPQLAPYLEHASVSVYKYKNEDGISIDKPQSLEEKSRLPSDHYPLFFRLKGLSVY